MPMLCDFVVGARRVTSQDFYIAGRGRVVNCRRTLSLENAKTWGNTPKLLAIGIIFGKTIEADCNNIPPLFSPRNIKESPE
jgi:hypothetical protein